MTVTKQLRALEEHEVNADTIKQLLILNAAVLLLPQKDVGYVFIRHACVEHCPIGVIESIVIGFLESDVTQSIEALYKTFSDSVTSCEYYLPQDRDTIISDYLFARLKSRFPQNKLNNGLSIDQIFVKQTRSLNFQDHTYYLVCVIQEFWKRTNNRELDVNLALGIVESNIHSFISNKHLWISKGLDFNRACLIYSLTTRRMPNEERRRNGGKWVIEKYNYFLPIVQETEQHVAQTLYHLT